MSSVNNNILGTSTNPFFNTTNEVQRPKGKQIAKDFFSLKLSFSDTFEQLKQRHNGKKLEAQRVQAVQSPSQTSSSNLFASSTLSSSSSSSPFSSSSDWDPFDLNAPMPPLVFNPLPPLPTVPSYSRPPTRAQMRTHLEKTEQQQVEHAKLNQERRLESVQTYIDELKKLKADIESANSKYANTFSHSTLNAFSHSTLMSSIQGRYGMWENYLVQDSSDTPEIQNMFKEVNALKAFIESALKAALSRKK